MTDIKKVTLREIHGELYMLALMRKLYIDKDTSVTWPQVMETSGRITGMISLAYAQGILTKEEKETLNYEKIDTLCGEYTAEDYEK